MPPEDELQRYAEGIALLKQFEGCRLKAYRDPVGVWTIGWGSTRRADGTPVKAGDKVTQAQADAMLATELGGKVLPALRKIPHWEEMAPEQQGALISFAWNLGWDFYGHPDFATISRVLEDREWGNVPVAMLLYRNPGTSVEEGLRRRREAEGILWSRGLRPVALDPAPEGEGQRIRARQATWLKKRPVQAAVLGGDEKVAVEQGRSFGFVRRIPALEEGGHEQVILAAGAGTWWIYPPHWEEPSSGDAPAAAPKGGPLKVPYQAQLDNADGQGARECFSSSCAMLAMFWGRIDGDDAYNVRRAKHGDSTDAAAQVATLKELGLNAAFHTDGKPEDLEREIDAGRPVAVGWLHHGPVSAPSGGGHWTVVIGYTETHWIMHDPYGEADLVKGGYVNHSRGNAVLYSRKNWNERWMPRGSKGWYISVNK